MIRKVQQYGQVAQSSTGFRAELMILLRLFGRPWMTHDAYSWFRSTL